jgi:hypothetical protein
MRGIHRNLLGFHRVLVERGVTAEEHESGVGLNRVADTIQEKLPAIFCPEYRKPLFHAGLRPGRVPENDRGMGCSRGFWLFGRRAPPRFTWGLYARPTRPPGRARTDAALRVGT